MRSFLACIALFALASSSALAQNVATIRGFVTSSDQGQSTALSDANVRVTGSNGVWETVTDKQGWFSFWELPPGRYQVTAAHTGYRFWPFASEHYVCLRAGTDQLLSFNLSSKQNALDLPNTSALEQKYITEVYGPNPYVSADLYSRGDC